MIASWSRDLFRIGSAPHAASLFARVGLAVGLPLIGLTLAGHPQAAVAGGAATSPDSAPV